MTNNKFIRRFHYIESKLKESGKNPEDVSLKDMDKYWEESKKYLEYFNISSEIKILSAHRTPDEVAVVAKNAITDYNKKSC